MDKDGMLNKLEFCLFMYLTKAVKRGGQIPPAGITPLQVRRLSLHHQLAAAGCRDTGMKPMRAYTLRLPPSLPPFPACASGQTALDAGSNRVLCMFKFPDMLRLDHPVQPTLQALYF